MPVPSNSSWLCRRWNTPNSFSGIFRIETGAVVADEDHGFAVAGGNTTDFDSGLGAITGKLHRIGNQIDQHHRSKSRSARTGGSGWIFHAIFRSFVSA